MSLSLPHQQNNIELNLDLLALDLTNDLNPVRFDGTPPTVEPDKVMVASLIDMPGLLVQSVIGQTTGESVYYYINDHLGTPQKVIDGSEAVVWSADYEPFGEAAVTVNTMPSNFRFPGQYHDGETGLHYNWYRYYGPGTGRYLRVDPLGLVGGINVYAYAYHDPINATDPYVLYRQRYIHEFELISTFFEIRHFQGEMRQSFRHEAETSPELGKYWNQLYQDYPFADAVLDWLWYTADEAMEHHRQQLEYRHWMEVERYRKPKGPCEDK